jgi:hypothetical protein
MTKEQRGYATLIAFMKVAILCGIAVKIASLF